MQAPEITESTVIKRQDTMFSPKIAYLLNNRVVTAYRKVLYFWDTDNLSLVDVINTKSNVSDMQVLSDGSLLTQHYDRTLKRWYFDADIIGNTIFTPQKRLYSWTCLPNNIIVFGGENGDLEFRHLDTMRLTSPVIQSRKSIIHYLAYQGGSHLISLLV